MTNALGFGMTKPGRAPNENTGRLLSELVTEEDKNNFFKRRREILVYALVIEDLNSAAGKLDNDQNLKKEQKLPEI